MITTISVRNGYRTHEVVESDTSEKGAITGVKTRCGRGWGIKDFKLLSQGPLTTVDCHDCKDGRG